MINGEPEVTARGTSRDDEDALLVELRRAIGAFDPMPARVAAAGRTTLARVLLLRDLPSSGGLPDERPAER